MSHRVVTALAATVRVDVVRIVRVARCLCVSFATTLLSLTSLWLLAGPIAIAPWLANVFATALGTGPSYVLNRRWVWGRAGVSDPWREVVPFWTISFAGLLLSTAAVATVGAWTESAGWTGGPRPVALLLANVGSFAVLWVVQFVVLDRYVFASRVVAGSRDAGRGCSEGSLLA